MASDFDKIAKELADLLKESGITLHLITKAASGSHYYRFNLPGLGKLRIGNHKERKRYGYRWQIRVDMDKAYFCNESKGHRRFFYRHDNLENAARHISNYAGKILEAVDERR